MYAPLSVRPCLPRVVCVMLLYSLQYNDETFWEPDAYEDDDEGEPSRTDRSTDVNDIDFAPARKLTPADRE